MQSGCSAPARNDGSDSCHQEAVWPCAAPRPGPYLSDLAFQRQGPNPVGMERAGRARDAARFATEMHSGPSGGGGGRRRSRELAAPRGVATTRTLATTRPTVAGVAGAQGAQPLAAPAAPHPSRPQLLSRPPRSNRSPRAATNPEGTRQRGGRHRPCATCGFLPEPAIRSPPPPNGPPAALLSYHSGAAVGSATAQAPGPPPPPPAPSV